MYLHIYKHSLLLSLLLLSHEARTSVKMLLLILFPRPEQDRTIGAFRSYEILTIATTVLLEDRNRIE